MNATLRRKLWLLVQSEGVAVDVRHVDRTETSKRVTGRTIMCRCCSDFRETRDRGRAWTIRDRMGVIFHAFSRHGHPADDNSYKIDAVVRQLTADEYAQVETWLEQRRRIPAWITATNVGV